MTPDDMETLAEIRGALQAFEWVNHHGDHGYHFQITTTTRSESVTSDVASHFSPHRVTVDAMRDWRDTLTNTLVRWLFAYLNGGLVDKTKSFAMSLPRQRGVVVDQLISRIESIGSIQSALSITVDTDFPSCDNSDIVLVLENYLVFLHFDVGD